jgi:primosomal protein N''
MITAQQFQWIVDRLAAQYAALATAIQALSPAPTRGDPRHGERGRQQRAHLGPR